MKSLLLINGSPRREASATYAAAKAFAGGMESAGYRRETVNVADLLLAPCAGCLSCWGRTPGECVIRDDAVAVRDRIDRSDAVLLCYPLYFFGMPGPVKTLTDRLLGMMRTYRGDDASEGGIRHSVRRPREGRLFAVLVSCAFTEGEDALLPLWAQYDRICGRGGYTGIACPQLKTLVDLGESARLTRYLERFAAAGKRYAEAGSLDEAELRELSRPPFSPKTYRTLLDAFWRGEEEKGAGR